VSERKRIRHMAKLISEQGVSAQCFEKPRAINMRRENWTTDPDAVTCVKCKTALDSLSTLKEPDRE
jgi:hypothetical protein